MVICLLQFECVHNDLINTLYDKNVLDTPLRTYVTNKFLQNDFIIIQRDRNSNNICIGESADANEIRDNKDFQNKILNIYKLAKEKNTNLNFIIRSIDDYDESAYYRN